jgi:hypothetical protein
MNPQFREENRHGGVVLTGRTPQWLPNAHLLCESTRMADSTPPTRPIEVLGSFLRKPASGAWTALSYGKPGGFWRRQYLDRLRGCALVDQQEASGTSGAAEQPLELRRSLASAVAEEEAARILSTLGISYTVWHDVATDAAGARAEQKIDHVVLGPTGIFAVLSADWGAPLTLRKGELVSSGLAQGEKPLRSLYRRAHTFARTTGVRFNALMMVVPDEAVAVPLAVASRRRGCPTLLVGRSWLSEVLQTKMGGMTVTSDDELLAARLRLGQSIHFV